MLDESLFKSSLRTRNNPRLRNMRKQNASRHVSRANRVSNASLKIYHRCFLVFQLNRARASNNSLKLSLSLSLRNSMESNEFSTKHFPITGCTI